MSSHSPLHLAIDLGASSGRVLVGNLAEGEVLLEEVHRFANGPVLVGKRLHWNLLGLWQEIEVGLSVAAKRYGDRIKSIGVDTWGVDYVLLDENLDLLGPAFCYRDARTVGILEKAWHQMSRQAIFQETGLQFMEFNSLFQLWAMRLESPALLDQAKHFLMIPDFLHWMLTGVLSNESTNASTTQLLRPMDGTWSQPIAEAFSIPLGLFSRPVQPGHRLGLLLPELAKRTGMPSVPIIVPATHDTGSAVLAVPARDFAEGKPNWCYISSGTWSLMGVELTEPQCTNKCMELNFTNEGGALGTTRLLKNIAGLWPLQQLRVQWERDERSLTWETCVAMAEAAPPLVSLFPIDDPRFVAPKDMLATIQAYYQSSGQKVLTEIGPLVRSCLESLALRYRTCLGWLEEILGYSLETIHIVGGGARNPLLCQMTADVCQRRVVAGPVEATAIGNLMMQSIGCKELDSIAEARRMLSQSPEIVTYLPQASQQPWLKAESRLEDEA